MGYKKISLKLPVDYSEEQLRNELQKELNVKEFSYQIENKSLDARRKNNIHWFVQVIALSKEISGDEPVVPPSLFIPYQKRKEKVVIIGSGPAGFFSAFVLQKAGFNTTLIERGSDVTKRAIGIAEFEQTGVFNPVSNYAFGEGGAGTFSDGKLTSRSKHIAKEKQFMLSAYIDAGAPEEIKYLTHPHLGSDNLKNIIKNLRVEFQRIGGTILFETSLTNLNIQNKQVIEAVTTSGNIRADYFIIASGHSAYETYRMLIKSGVIFRTKNFAIGCRVEHPQEIINLAQWGVETIPRVKAAEYRLTSKADGRHPVYTFCMCPGGTIVPATAYKHTNIVNGMSLYKRNGTFANAACVAGIHPDELAKKTTSPIEALECLETLEQSFYNYSHSFQAPFCTIQDFINRKKTNATAQTSYPLGLITAPLWQLLPADISNSIAEGLKDFSKKIKGFDTGIIMGLESKTSSPIQVVREKNGLCEGFDNLYMVGEGSGYAGGIISSGVDGIKVALNIINANINL